MMVWYDLADLRELVHALRCRHSDLVSAARSRCGWVAADGTLWAALQDLFHEAWRTLFVPNLFNDGGRHIHVELLSPLLDRSSMKLCHLFQLLYHLWAAKVILILVKDLIDFASHDRLPHKVCSVRPIFLRRIVGMWESDVSIDTLNLGDTSILHNRLQIGD